MGEDSHRNYVKPDANMHGQESQQTLPQPKLVWIIKSPKISLENPLLTTEEIAREVRHP